MLTSPSTSRLRYHYYFRETCAQKKITYSRSTSRLGAIYPSIFPLNLYNFLFLYNYTRKKWRKIEDVAPNVRTWCDVVRIARKKMFFAIFNFSTCLIVFIFFILPLILNLNICVIQNTSLVLSHSFFSFTSTLFMNTFGCFSSSFLLFSLPSAFHFFICTKSYILLWNFHEIRNFWTVCCAVIMQCFWSKILTAANMHCHDLINLAIYMSNAISIIAF